MSMYFRALSKSMIEQLILCQKIGNENNLKQYRIEDMRHALAPLYKRGLIEVRKNEMGNKFIYCIVLTQAGKDYLKRIKNKSKYFQKID